MLVPKAETFEGCRLLRFNGHSRAVESFYPIKKVFDEKRLNKAPRKKNLRNQSDGRSEQEVEMLYQYKVEATILLKKNSRTWGPMTLNKSPKSSTKTFSDGSNSRTRRQASATKSPNTTVILKVKKWAAMSSDKKNVMNSSTKLQMDLTLRLQWPSPWQGTAWLLWGDIGCRCHKTKVGNSLS